MSARDPPLSSVTVLGTVFPHAPRELRVCCEQRMAYERVSGVFGASHHAARGSIWPHLGCSTRLGGCQFSNNSFCAVASLTHPAIPDGHTAIFTHAMIKFLGRLELL